MRAIYLMLVGLSGLLLLASCAAVDGGDYDLQRTWRQATVILPPVLDAKMKLRRPTDKLVTALARAGDADGGKRFGLALYMHGCDGLGSNGLTLMRGLARRGLVVVAPNSMARRYRPLQCDPRHKTGGVNIFVFEFRLAELSFALDRIWALPGIDKRRLFLIGTSEGGVAAALYRGDEFSARVILQWTCHGAPLVHGLLAPPAEPVLAMVRAADPWYDPARTKGQSGDCGAYFGDRPKSLSIVLGDNAGGHDVLGARENRQRIIEFLAENKAFREPE